jgi:hypothetical protein
MAPSVMLFAWTVPAYNPNSPVDHTWVTTYDNRVHPYPTDADVIAAGEYYWYCWGSFHPTGGTPVDPTGFIGQQAGDLNLAKCLVLPNADSNVVAAARGTIFVYGVDGVCHQLANQVLYATSSGGVRPLTVHNARGYLLSSFIYGTYGLQPAAWASKIASCSATSLVAQRRGPGEVKMASEQGALPEPDEFERRAIELLGAKDPALLSNLLHLRADVNRFAARAWPGTGQPSAEALNARNQHMFDEAAKLLGPEHFRALFGIEPGTKVDLVDPNVANSAGEIPPPKAR